MRSCALRYHTFYRHRQGLVTLRQELVFRRQATDRSKILYSSGHARAYRTRVRRLSLAMNPAQSAPIVSILRDHVVNVIAHGALEDVGASYTRRVIATMKGARVGPSAFVQEKCNPVRSFRETSLCRSPRQAFVDSHDSISRFVQCVCPKPTRSQFWAMLGYRPVLVDFGPEKLRQGAQRFGHSGSYRAASRAKRSGASAPHESGLALEIDPTPRARKGSVAQRFGTGDRAMRTPSVGDVTRESHERRTASNTSSTNARRSVVVFASHREPFFLVDHAPRTFARHGVHLPAT